MLFKTSRYILAGACALAFGASAAAAEFTDIDGTYAGTFICSSGEMGMSMSLKDTGPATQDMLGEPCASASGSCNDLQNALLENSRAVSGVINFFPTAGNPDAPAGAFRVNGTANHSIDIMPLLNLQPGEWIDQPKGFGSSGLEGRILDGEVYGKPTASGCYTLKMRKLRTQPEE